MDAGEAGKPAIRPKDRRLCAECVEEPYLREVILDDGHEGTCSYCEENGKTLSVDDVADRVAAVLSKFFFRTAAQPLDDSEVPTGGWRRAGQPVVEVIAHLVDCRYLAADDIRCVLSERENDLESDQTDTGERPFDAEAHYARNRSVDAGDFDSYWYAFERGLKTKNRYFNWEAHATLTSIFAGIDGLNTTTGRPVIVEAGPGTNLTALYRARVFQSEKKLRDAMKRPDLDLGPPPPSNAIAGRMNAAGIAVFYGATDPDVALTEVRPPVGSRVLIATFEVIHPLRLLDLEALESVRDGEGSVFDPGHVNRLEQAAFLRGLSGLISEPVMPNDEARDYIPTQAIADFLAAMTDPALDGIIYPSVQVDHRPTRFRMLGGGADRRNVVLFQKSARVQTLDIPEGTDVSVSDDDIFSMYQPGLFGGPNDVPGFPDNGSELNYTVFEKVPNAAPASEPDDAPLRFSSLEVRSVKGVEFKNTSSQVSRYRDEAPS
jgi:hypothetical protein